MKYRVWCSDIEHWSDGHAIEARSDQDAAHDYMANLDASGRAFPEDNDGDTCTIRVCAWEDVGDDVDELDEPESVSFTFKLVIE